MEPVFDVIGADALHIDPIRPWLSANAHAFDAMSVADRFDQILGRQSTLVRTALEFILGNDNCAVPSRQSYLGLLSLVSAGRMGSDREGMRGFWQYTETHRCGNGNDQLAAALARSINDLRLVSPAVSVSVEDAGVTVDAGNVCETYDYAILAAPPFTWPAVESSHRWDPAAYTMAHGPAIKHLNRFPTKFWEDHHLSPSAIWDYLGSVWEGTDQQAGTSGYALSCTPEASTHAVNPCIRSAWLSCIPGTPPRAPASSTGPTTLTS
jgi:monoamine oxidase